MRVDPEGSQEAIAMDERRRHERYGRVFPAEVTNRETKAVIGLLADVSSGGLMVRAERPLAPGTRLKLAVELPPAGSERRDVFVEARVCWCDEDLEPGSHVLGLEFVGATPESSPIVENLIRVLKDRP